MIYIGIDPGLNGGIAIISKPEEFCKTSAAPMPVNKNEIDSATLYRNIKFLEHYSTRIFAVVEESASRPNQGVVSMFTFGKRYGKILGVLEILGIEHRIVKPQAWKNVVLSNTAEDKLAAIDYCKRNYPEIDLCKNGKDHDGMADATCIARYAQLLYEKNKTLLG